MFCLPPKYIEIGSQIHYEYFAETSTLRPSEIRCFSLLPLVDPALFFSYEVFLPSFQKEAFESLNML
jgi:hypothetical protein